MPFNEKGEFIRPESSPARQPRAHRTGSSQPQVAMAGRARITSSDDRPAPRRRPHEHSQASIDGWEVVGALLFGLLAIAALIGAVWLVLTFHRWILIGLGLWAVTCLRRLFR